MSYAGTIEYLYGLQAHGIKLGLQRPRRMLSLFGGPQGAFRSVHVAGTNGKGSTSAALASILAHAGIKAGLFTSPHLVSFTERIRVDGVEITEDEVVSLAGEIRMKTEGLEPTFFEVVTVMGFLHFMRKGVDWAVVEAGMGGRLDATNVLRPEATIITPIDIDHGEFLGESLTDIAREKAGIIKKGVPVVSASQLEGAGEVIASRAAEKGAALSLEGRDFGFAVKEQAPGRVVFDYCSGGLSLPGLELPLSGAHQAQNASLAIQAFELITGGVGKKEGAVREGLRALRWPGRLELVAEEPPVLLDGAHNPAAARALARTLKEQHLGPESRLVLVVGVMSDKDADGILGPLLPLASEIILTAAASGRSAPPEALSRVAASQGFRSKTAATVGEALSMARRSGGMVLVTGSFYTIGEAREAMGQRGFLSGLREQPGSG